MVLGGTSMSVVDAQPDRNPAKLLAHLLGHHSPHFIELGLQQLQCLAAELRTVGQKVLVDEDCPTLDGSLFVLDGGNESFPLLALQVLLTSYLLLRGELECPLTLSDLHQRVVVLELPQRGSELVGDGPQRRELQFLPPRHLLNRDLSIEEAGIQWTGLCKHAGLFVGPRHASDLEIDLPALRSVNLLQGFQDARERSAGRDHEVYPAGCR
jgi:hypothetical protein